MSFIAITYGYNQYSIFNTNVATNPLLDNILSTCLDDMINLLTSKLPQWEEQINNYNNEEDQIKKSTKKLETDKLISEEKANEANKPKDSGALNSSSINSNENHNVLSNSSNSNNKKGNAGNNQKAAAANSKFIF